MNCFCSSSTGLVHIALVTAHVRYFWRHHRNLCISPTTILSSLVPRLFQDKTKTMRKGKKKKQTKKMRKGKRCKEAPDSSKIKRKRCEKEKKKQTKKIRKEKRCKEVPDSSKTKRKRCEMEKKKKERKDSLRCSSRRSILEGLGTRLHPLTVHAITPSWAANCLYWEERLLMHEFFACSIFSLSSLQRQHVELMQQLISFLILCRLNWMKRNFMNADPIQKRKCLYSLAPWIAARPVELMISLPKCSRWLPLAFQLP